MTNEFRTTRTETSRVESHIDLGHLDDKDRKIGLKVITGTADFADRVEGVHQSFYYTKAPGSYFWAFAQTTRDGETFGATQGFVHFPTEAERDAYLAKRIAKARKRYVD